MSKKRSFTFEFTEDDILVSSGALAKVFNRSQQQIGNYKDIKFIKRGGKKLYPLREAVVYGVKKGVIKIATDIETNETIKELPVAVQKDYWDAKLKEQKYLKDSGELIDIDSVQKEAFEIARVLRDSFLNIPDRVSALIASKNSEHEVAQILKQEIGQVLSMISGDEYEHN